MEVLVSSQLAAISPEQLQALSIPSRVLHMKNALDILAIFSEQMLTRQSFVSGIWRNFCDCKAYRNSLMPVNLLTDEMLTTIFSYLLNDDSPHKLRVLGALTLVCRRWNVIVRHAYQLWNSFLFRDGAVALRHVERSGDLPLHITIDERVETEDLHILADRLDSLQSFLPRVETLQVTFDHGLAAKYLFSKIRQLPSSVLSSLSVTNAYREPRSIIEALTFSNVASLGPWMTELKSLVFRDVELHILEQTCGAPYKLRHLDLSYEFVPPLLSRFLVALLYRCKRLEIVRLHSRKFSFAYAPSPRFPSIYLVHLKKFVFEGTGVLALAHILATIKSAANSTLFDLTLYLDDPDVADWFLGEPEGLITRRRTLTLTFPRKLRRLEMRWDGGDELVLRAAHEITGDPITEYVRLTIKPRDPDMLGYYAPLSAWPIDVTALKVLHITWGLSIGMLSSVREWLALLTQTPALTALHLDRSPEAPEDLCLALYATSPKPSKLVCPQLNILTITRPRWASDQYTPIICKMLRLRDQVGGQPLHVVLENVDGWSEEDQNLLVEAGFADRVNLVQT